MEKIMASLPAVDQLDTTSARLPIAYEQAKAALARCASIDECQTWKNKAQALASYARQADDDTLQKTAMRIQSRAVRRCGELLKDFDGQGARTDKLPDPADRKLTMSEAAKQAGLSDRQRTTAVRVANVPTDLFNEVVDGEKPPTVTALADMGRKSAAGEPPVHPGFRAAIVFMGHTRRLAEFTDQNEVGTVRGAVAPHEVRELRQHVAKCRRFLDAIAPRLWENSNEL